MGHSRVACRAVDLLQFAPGHSKRGVRAIIRSMISYPQLAAKLKLSTAYFKLLETPRR